MSTAHGPDRRLDLQIDRQPDPVSCGPTCLHAIYRYYGKEIPLSQMQGDVPMLENGGTLSVLLGLHAIQSGYRAAIYSYNLHLFDPTWFAISPPELQEKLRLQMAQKQDPKLQLASSAYLEFLAAGGAIRFADLSEDLLLKYLDRSVPLVVGLSATYLYQSAREYGPHSEYDDVRGEPCGHFVVLCGYNQSRKTVTVADPHFPNKLSSVSQYEVSLTRLIGAIFLGIATYDANLLAIEPAQD